MQIFVSGSLSCFFTFCNHVRWFWQIYRVRSEWKGIVFARELIHTSPPERRGYILEEQVKFQVAQPLITLWNALGFATFISVQDNDWQLWFILWLTVLMDSNFDWQSFCIQTLIDSPYGFKLWLTVLMDSNFDWQSLWIPTSIDSPFGFKL